MLLKKMHKNVKEAVEKAKNIEAITKTKEKHDMPINKVNN